jgi:thiol-disulfide isomerase/thioredoxin
MQADLRRWNRLAGDLWEQRKKASPRTAEADIPWPSPPPDWQARLRERAQHAQDRFVRQAWLFESLWLATAAKQVEASWVRSTLQELTPASPFWQWNPGVAAAAVLASGQPEQYQEYLNQIIDGLPHASLKGTVVAAIFTQLQRERRADLAQPWLVRMKTEFAQNRRVKAALARYESERKVKPGKPVPAFSARSLDDPKVAYTNASLAGKVYLLDFWATWCGPCAYQIPYIQRAYARYKSKGFEVLSYSVDGSREAVRRYRAERFPMPWLHAIDAELRGRESPLAILFEVYEYPTAVLVDGREGKIVAVGEEITGDKLEAMLARFWPE